MKRLRSSDDLDSYGEKAASKDWGRREEESSSHRSLTHRSSYYKSESGRKGVSSSSSRYDRLEDDRDSSRSARKRSDYDTDSYDRRKGYDRYRESSNERGILSSSPRGGYGPERIHRSESFSGLRREFPKGFRSERDRSRREGSVSSWRRFGGGKEGDEGIRSSGESVKISKVESEDVGKAKSSPGTKDAKSPPWSKDSGSEQSKSIEVKKGEELPVESAGNSSEMEEGELEPDPQPASASQPATEDPASDGFHQKRVDTQQPIEPKLPEDKTNQEHGKVSVHKELVEGREPEDIQNAVKPVDELPGCQSSTQVTNGGCDEIGTRADTASCEGEEQSRRNISNEEGNDPFAVKPQSSKEERRGEKGIDLEVKTDESDLPEVNKGPLEETGTSITVPYHALEEIKENFKGEGKTGALSPSNCTLLTVNEFRIANEPRVPVTCTDSPMEGPSTRGFELFLTGPVKKPEKDVPCINNKIKDEKLALDLSLSLPNVLLPIGSHNTVQAPGSPSQAKSVQSFHSSFRTNSDGFTASMSFSGSQQFTHNPSCSLTHNEMDFEQSVKSRPLFQGVDWQALASDEPKNKEVPLVQSMLPNGNGLHQQSQASQGNSSGQPVARRHRTLEGSFRTGVELERQLSFNKRFSVVHSQHSNDVRSPSQSAGSHETGSGYVKDKKRAMREKDSGSLCRISNPEAKGQLWMMGSDFLESIITMVVSDPINIVAQRFGEMSGQQMAFLKECVRDILLNPSKQAQRRAFQKALEKRSDLSLEMLQLKSHRSQLEILVAMKTGLQEFIHFNPEISSSELAEMFLNMRCRNLTCRSLLPVDECDCKICSKKNGFCSACMCLVCSKFDMASNTCSWVGCDVCLHWCHADCGLRESYIRNGCSATGAEGTTEMQFHCLACDHPSEMFGFVKEVFQNFAKEWTEENLSRELAYVRRIFSASEDLRGKRLHEIAIQMLSKLENKVDLQEVQNHIMRFLTDTDSLRPCNTPIAPRKELSLKNDEKSNGIVGSSQEAEWLKSGRVDKAPQFEKSAGLFASIDGNRDDKRPLKLESHISASKEYVFDELESIVRIKHAEAKMFQMRADDARREAEALKRISLSKNERIEEEYTSRISKLRLADAEEMRKQKLEELQSLERAYQDYFHMKMRMEADIKDLLLKMDATRRNLTI